MLSNLQTKNILEVRDLGLIDCAVAYEIQKEAVARVIAGGVQTVFLCEHPTVITLGRMSHEEHILNRETIERVGIRVVPIDRGGDVTLHAPGQLVVYPILSLAGSRDLRLYMSKLEQVTIALLKSFGIVANRISGKTGVFVGQDKIASLGIGVRKWVTYHGLGINVNTDLKFFDLIRPCGLDVRMTSVAQIKGQAVEMGEVKKRFVEYFSKELL